MREHKQIIERGKTYVPGDVRAAELRADTELAQLHDIYGDRIVDVQKRELKELFAVYGDITYLINVYIELPDIVPICLPSGFLVSYE